MPPKTRIEGEIQQLDADYPVNKIWEVIAGRRDGLASKGAMALFDSGGFAIQGFRRCFMFAASSTKRDYASNLSCLRIRTSHAPSTGCCYVSKAPS